MRITGYDPIQTETKWKRSGLTLGQAVHAVVQHLQLNPPEILEITDAGLRSIQPKNSRFRQNGSIHSNGSTSNHNYSSGHGPSASTAVAPPSYDATLRNQKRAPQLPPPPDVSLPSIPRNFDSILDTKTREDFENLLSNDLQFLALIHRLDVFGEIQTMASSKSEETKRMAQDNLAKEEALKSSRSEADRLRASLKSKVERFQALEQEQDALCAPLDVRSTLRQLKEAKKEAFESSEAFAEEWVEDGAPDVDKFMKDFIQRRKVHHERASKMEILQQQGVKSLR